MIIIVLRITIITINFRLTIIFRYALNQCVNGIGSMSARNKNESAVHAKFYSCKLNYSIFELIIFETEGVNFEDSSCSKIINHSPLILFGLYPK